MDNIIFNTKKLIQYKNSKINDWDKYNFIFKKFSKHFFLKLSELNINFENILVLTSDFYETYNQLENLDKSSVFFLSQYKNFLTKAKFLSNVTKIFCSFDILPFKEKSFDLIIHNFSLNNINNIDKHLKKIFSLLKDDGLLLCNFFGEDSLIELRKSLMKTDTKVHNGVYTRISPTLKMVNVVDLMGKIGFKEIVSEIINYQVFYRHSNDLINDIRGVGENTVFRNINKGLKTSNYFEKLNKIYFENFSEDKKIFATCEIISITTWKQNLGIN